MSQSKKVILAVSFGTSYEETSRKNIDAIEEELRNSCCGYEVRRAYTSKMIIKKLWERDQIHINSVEEALEALKEESVEELIVQPTHIINGIENDSMIEALSGYKNHFPVIKLGTPLITNHEDYMKIITFIQEDIVKKYRDSYIVFMGHGSSHHSNAAYAALDYYCKSNGLHQVYVGTVEGYPTINEILRYLDKDKYKNVVLMPLMIVAGDHAINDMASEEESWYTMVRDSGFEAQCIIKGLGEYKAIRQMFVEHALKAQNPFIKEDGDSEIEL